MSQENVEIVRRALQSYNDSGLDGLAEFLDENINWRAAEGAPDDVGEINGIEAMRRYMGDFPEQFTDVTLVPIEVLDLGDARVLAVQRMKGRARISGIETDITFAVVYTIRGGKIVHGREYLERAAALKAVGLEE
jgi:ketosteroid isomerase-like protein